MVTAHAAGCPFRLSRPKEQKAVQLMVRALSMVVEQWV